MENKSNSLNRIKRQQREKVLRFSIRKYSFGAASVAVAVSYTHLTLPTKA